MSELQTEITGSTVVATLNRPEALNAINFDIMARLEELLNQLEQDQQIRTFILTGAGDEVFISGGDLKEFHGITSAEEAEDMARRMGSILKRIEKLPCWTIAAVNGAAYGGGWEMMLAFDFRIASADATFHFSQGKFYLPPGWGGLTRLIEKVGRSTALCWLAEATEIDAEMALAKSLIGQIAPKEQLAKKAEKWAAELSHNDRAFIKALKQGALRYSKAHWKSIEDELGPFAKFWEDERHLERVEKFLNRKEE